MKQHINNKIADILYDEIDFLDDQLIETGSLKEVMVNLNKTLLDFVIRYVINNEYIFKPYPDLDIRELASFIINNIHDLIDDTYYTDIPFKIDIEDLVNQAIKVSKK